MTRAPDNGCRQCNSLKDENGEMHCRILHALCGTQIHSSVIFWNPRHELHNIFPDIEFHMFGKRGFMTRIREMADWTEQNGCGLFERRTYHEN